MAHKIILLQECFLAIIALVWGEVFVMNFDMLTHIIELSELLVADSALEDLVVTT